MDPHKFSLQKKKHFRRNQQTTSKNPQSTISNLRGIPTASFERVTRPPQLSTARVSAVPVSPRHQDLSGLSWFVWAPVPRDTRLCGRSPLLDYSVVYPVPVCGLLVYGHRPFPFIPKGPFCYCLLRLRALSFTPTGPLVTVFYTYGPSPRIV